MDPVFPTQGVPPPPPPGVADFPPIQVGQADAVFQHLLQDILRFHPNSPPVLALTMEGIHNVVDLITLEEDFFPHLVFFPRPNPGSPPEPAQYIPRGHTNLLQLFVRFARKLQQDNMGVPLSLTDWADLTPEDFDSYRLSYPPRSLPSPIPPHAPGHTVRTTNRAAEFQKSIKRDETHYPELKDEKYWDSWNRSVLTRAQAHDIGEVFDPTYSPPEHDEEEQRLFYKKQVFAMTVFNRCVQTDMGRHFVRQHAHNCDAQSVYRKLVEYAKISTSAQISVDELIEYLNIARLDSTWKSSSQKFLIQWRDKLRQLQEITPLPEHYADNVKKRMLEAAVRLIPALGGVKSIDEHNVAIGQPPLSFDAYFNLLVSAAVRRDHQLGNASRSRHTVNAHHLNHSEALSGHDYGEFDVDHTWSAHNTERSPPTRRPYIDPELWAKLPPEAQQFLRSFNPRTATPSSTRSVHVHESLSQEPDESTAPPAWDNPDHGYDPMEIGEPSPEDFAPAADQSDQMGDATQPLLAHLTQRQPLPPGDVRRILAANRGPGVPRRSGIPPPQVPQPGTSPKDSIILNGKKYIQADTHCISFSISCSITAQVASLVDRGANGGMAGEDVRLLETGEKMADVRGIDNH